MISKQYILSMSENKHPLVLNEKDVINFIQKQWELYPFDDIMGVDKDGIFDSIEAIQQKLNEKAELVCYGVQKELNGLHMNLIEVISVIYPEDL